MTRELPALTESGEILRTGRRISGRCRMERGHDRVGKESREVQNMRVNIYKEELTDRVEIVENGDQPFTGLRFYLYLPVTQEDGSQSWGPFMHRDGDDDSSAITFWFGEKRKLREVLEKALACLDALD